MSKTLKKLLGVGLLILVAMGVMAPAIAATAPTLDTPAGQPQYVADSTDTSYNGGPLPPTPEPPPPPQT